MQSPLNLILLGDPGAGKATQGRRLVKKYALREFDFGSWLRSLKSPADRRKYKVAQILKGILAPTDLAKQKFREVILTTPSNRGVFFNGNPKMVGEAKTVVKAFKEARRTAPLVLYISIPQKEMLSRLAIRKQVEGRSDDNPLYLKNRMRYYRKNIHPMVEYLKTQYKVVKIPGVGTEAEVFKRLEAAIKKFHGSH